MCRLQHTSPLSYSKQEGLGVADLSKFDWLLTSPHEAERLGLLARFDIVETIYAFKKLSIRRAAPVERFANAAGLPFRVDLGRVAGLIEACRVSTSSLSPFFASPSLSPTA